MVNVFFLIYCVLCLPGPRYLYVDMAAMSVGAVPLGIYPNESSSGIQYVLENSGARVLFVDSQEQLEKTASFRSLLSPNFLVSFISCGVLYVHPFH